MCSRNSNATKPCNRASVQYSVSDFQRTRCAGTGREYSTAHASKRNCRWRSGMTCASIFTCVMRHSASEWIQRLTMLEKTKQHSRSDLVIRCTNPRKLRARIAASCRCLSSLLSSLDACLRPSP
eukprot:3425764-Rhodomonas_salina.1